MELPNSLYLGTQVGSDPEMVPRQMLGAVPLAMAVPNGVISTTQLANGSVTTNKLVDMF